MSGDADNMRAGAVAMRLLIRAGGHLRHVAGEYAVRQDKLDVARSGAAVGIGMEFDLRHVRDEIRLPHVIARANWDEIAFARKVAFLTGALDEIEIIFKDEALIVKRVHDERHVRR